jgi:transcriptional regulator
MYNIPYFKASSQDSVIKLMEEFPFAVLMGVDKDLKPVATQVPLSVEQREEGLFLKGHIMRNTSHHVAFESNSNVMALFHGPHAYISADWYENKEQASTWNYLSVQASGVITFLGENELVEILRSTTNRFEKKDSPSSFESLPETYVSKHFKAIIGFEIKVISLDHTFKLSQNKDKETFNAILTNLDQGDEQSRAMATQMRKHKQS